METHMTSAARDFEPLLTATEAAQQVAQRGFRVTAKTLYQWGASGKVPSRKVGRYRYFRLSELLSWVDAQLTSEGK